MKTIFKKTAIASALLFTITLSAQKDKFEGTVTYSMEMDMKDMPPEAAAMMKNSELILQVKNDRSRLESKTAMYSTTSVTDNKAQTGFTLLELMGSKYIIKTKPEDIKKDAERPDVKVKETTETKEIAGYKCKKAEVTTVEPQTKKEVVTIVYYTDLLPYTKGYGATFKGLKGFPLEYTIDADGGMHMKVTAKSVLKEKLNDSIFIQPTGYKETTTEDLQKEMMKNMGGGQ